MRIREAAMNKFQGMTNLSLVTLLMVSCTSKSDVSKAPTPKPSAPTFSAATPPLVPRLVNQPPQGLIASTQPTKIPIAQGRIDPFSSIAVAPIKQSIPLEKTQQTQTQQSKKQNPSIQKPKSQNPPAQNQQTPKPKNQNQNKSVTKPVLNNQKPVQNRPLPPAPPAIDLAKAVQVNGVMELGGRVSAIVKEPDEQISRTVSAGDYLSQGKVLVKRIEFNGNREPVVILEQNGVEVIKQVGSSGPVASI